MAKFTPFPTFGGKNGIAGITPVKLSPTQMRFPTARGPVRRAPEPTTKEKLAPFLPLVTEGIRGLIQGRPEVLSDSDYLTSIGADPEDPTFKEQTRLDAYKLYGPPKEKNRFGLDEILNIGVASQMGRGATNYGKTYFNLRTAEETDRLNTEKLRAEYIKSQKPTKYDYATLINVQAAQEQVNPFVTGRENTDTGELEILQPDGSYILAGDGFIKRTGTGNVEIPESPNVKLMADIFDPIYEKERAVSGLLSIATPTIDQLENLDPNAITPGTLTAAFTGLLNQGRIEFNNIGKLTGMDGRIFATVDDFNVGKAGNNGRLGTGLISKNTYQELKDTGKLSDKQLKQFEDMIQQETGKSFKDILGDTVYNDVRLRSRFLQLAYVAAAVNGQTGRTLSDKDLAYHIQIVGLGQTSDPKVLVKNLKSFVTDSVNGVDNEVKLAIQQNFPKLSSSLDDTYVQTHLKDFYAPNQENVYSMAIQDYTFRPFNIRRPGFGLENYITGTTGTGTGTGTSSTDYDNILNEIFE
jgi:hypothetical protein